MSQSERATRFARRVARAPQNLSHMHESIVATHDLVIATQTQLNELQATLEAISKAQLEALAFLNRSVNEVGARLEKLEQAGDTPDQ